MTELARPPEPSRRGRRPPRISSAGENAKREIERWRQYDYVVVNDDLQQAYARVSAIIAAERSGAARAWRKGWRHL